MNWPLITTIISAAAALVGGMILWNLNKLNENIRNLADRQTGQEKELGLIRDRMSTCRAEHDRILSATLQDLDREKVSKEDWIRSEAYTRAKIDGFGTSLATIAANVESLKQLPHQIAVAVREAVTAAKGG
jgi:septal ring factor EnvC (AmiA/AmiB activator)